MKELWIENDYFHIEKVIAATEMLWGSGTCSPGKFCVDWCNLVGFDVLIWLDLVLKKVTLFIVKNINDYSSNAPGNYLC